MANKPELNIEEMKAERKRLATARGLLTRERNKLAAEHEQHEALLAEVSEQQAELAAEWRQFKVDRDADRGREAEADALRARVEVAESQLELARAAVKTLKKKALKSSAKSVKKFAAKKAKKLVRKQSSKKLAKALAKIRKLEEALRAAQAYSNAPPK